MNKFLLEAASCQYSMCITNQGRFISLRLIMYKLYIVRIFDPPLSVSSKFTYKIFVLTHTSKLKLEKSIVFFPSQSVMVALLLCDRQRYTFHFAHIQQRHALLWACLLLCLICPKERVSSSRLVATSTLYIIPNSKLQVYGHLRTFADIIGQVFAQTPIMLFACIVSPVSWNNTQSFYKHLLLCC